MARLSYLHIADTMYKSQLPYSSFTISSAHFLCGQKILVSPTESYLRLSVILRFQMILKNIGARSLLLSRKSSRLDA